MATPPAVPPPPKTYVPSSTAFTPSVVLPSAPQSAQPLNSLVVLNQIQSLLQQKQSILLLNPMDTVSLQQVPILQQVSLFDPSARQRNRFYSVFSLS